LVRVLRLRVLRFPDAAKISPQTFEEDFFNFEAVFTVHGLVPPLKIPSFTVERGGEKPPRPQPSKDCPFLPHESFYRKS